MQERDGKQGVKTLFFTNRRTIIEIILKLYDKLSVINVKITVKKCLTKKENRSKIIYENVFCT